MFIILIKTQDYILHTSRWIQTENIVNKMKGHILIDVIEIIITHSQNQKIIVFI